MYVFYTLCSAEEFDDQAPPTFDNPSGTPIHFTSVVCTDLEFTLGSVNGVLKQAPAPTPMLWV